MTLPEFLLARIAEDEARARDDDAGEQWHQVRCGYWLWEAGSACDCGYPTRVLAECEAKRRIVERFKWAAEDPDLYRNDMALADQWEAAWDTLADAATIYADHDDYRPEWRP